MLMTDPSGWQGGSSSYRSLKTNSLWPLLIAKAICVVTRGRWTDASCLTWINNLCGWVTESTLVAELPPGEDDLDGREHFKSLTLQTWPRILPAVPHQVIVYEEDSESEEDDGAPDDNEEDEGLFGAIEAAEGLLAGGEAGEGAQENGVRKSQTMQNSSRTQIYQGHRRRRRWPRNLHRLRFICYWWAMSQ